MPFRDKAKDGTVRLTGGLLATRIGTTPTWAFGGKTDVTADFADGFPPRIGDLLVSENLFSMGQIYYITKVYPSGNVDLEETGVTFSMFRAPDVQIFTADDTWSKPWGAVMVEYEVLAAGGAGGGAGTASAGQNSAGSGGGAGGYAWGLLPATSFGTTEAVTVGAAGLGLANSIGGSGGESSFGTHAVCNGGSGGIVRATNAVDHWQEGGSGGTVTAGVLQVPGANGEGSNGNGVFGKGGAGASSKYGAGGKHRGTGTGSQPLSGYAATGYGAGGGGALCTGTTSVTRNGGNGSPGLIIVKSYFA